jgi:hypothetical protein
MATYKGGPSVAIICGVLNDGVGSSDGRMITIAN